VRIQELQSQFAIPGAVEFEPGQGGLTRMAITTSECAAHIYTHGAHVTHWQRHGEAPVLFMSSQSQFKDGAPIRGGVPVCFPWFGGSGPAGAPIHGVARLAEWEVESVTLKSDGTVVAVFLLNANERALAPWPQRFELRHRVTVGRSLTMALEARNTDPKPQRITEALHTYFLVDDVRQIRVLGLENASYIDTAGGGRVERRQGAEPITITAETDRVYLNNRATCVIEVPNFGRKIVIEKSGSDSTVVWNPWIAKAKAMPDFGDDEWPRMICVETANAHGNAITLAPGASHVMEARIRLET